MTRWGRGERPDATAYDQRFSELAASGKDVHGEVDFVMSMSVAPGSVLDAGCGTGRVAVELARRGVPVVGVDLDAGFLAGARAKAPSLSWVLGDLGTVDLGRRFDAVVAAGNVMIFVEPGTEAAVVANLARHLTPAGALVAGFQLNRDLTVDSYDGFCSAAGLVLAERWATWDRDPWVAGGDYAVSVHRPAS